MDEIISSASSTSFDGSNSETFIFANDMVGRGRKAAYHAGCLLLIDQQMRSRSISCSDSADAMELAAQERGVPFPCSSTKRLRADGNNGGSEMRLEWFRNC